MSSHHVYICTANVYMSEDITWRLLMTECKRYVYVVVREWIHAPEGVVLSDETTHLEECEWGSIKSQWDLLVAAERAFCKVFSDIDEFQIAVSYNLADTAKTLTRAYLIDMSVEELTAHLHTLLAAEAACVENEIPITWCEED